MEEIKIIGKNKPWRTQIALAPAIGLLPIGYLLIKNYALTPMSLISIPFVLGGLYNVWFFIKLNLKPTVIINKNHLVISNILGKETNIAPITEYSLINSNDYFGFRKGDNQDIILNRNFFNQEEAATIINALKELSFKQVIEGN
ncbi:MAG: hypothetical protein OEY29_15405 [Gammaproteobacteria bacterium]|nr:hypothetical protein [Gammaproteobacteria bacterium]